MKRIKSMPKGLMRAGFFLRPREQWNVAIQNFRNTSKLTYAPYKKKMEQMSYDVLDTNPMLREKVIKFNSERAIVNLKSQIVEVPNGDKMEILDFDKWTKMLRKGKQHTEEFLLTYWQDFVEAFGKNKNPIKQKQDRCRKLIKECLNQKYAKRSDIFKCFSEEEILAMKSEKIDLPQLIACLSGYKSAVYDSYPEKISVAIKNSKLADAYTVIRPTFTKANQTCILNNKQVKDIISNNREIFCKELKLDLNTSDDVIFEKLLYCIKEECPTKNNPTMFGLVLGYPKYSSLIYKLNNAGIIENRALCTQGKEFKELLIETLHHKNSPFKNYSQEFIEDLEHYIITENLNTYANPFEERFISSFVQFGSDFKDMRKIRQNEINFVNIFTPEWFLKQTNR